MDWYDKRLSQVPTQAEIDRLYFNLAMLIVAGLLLAFSLGVVVGSRITPPRQIKKPADSQRAEERGEVSSVRMSRVLEWPGTSEDSSSRPAWRG